MAKRGRPKGTRTLYSVWRNSDDQLLILDGTAAECCKLLHVTPNTFYGYISGHSAGRNYTIRKISPRDAELEGEQ